MCEVYSKYKRKQNNIEKAISNQEVNFFFTQHYKYLYSLLVKTDEDADTFNDTYLKITYNYNPDKDFIDQFKYLFNQLKGAYNRADKVEKYHFTQLNDIDYPEIIIDEYVTPDKSDFNELKNKVKEYAKRK